MEVKSILNANQYELAGRLESLKNGVGNYLSNNHKMLYSIIPSFHHSLTPLFK
jgi:hypothetical protein